MMTTARDRMTDHKCWKCGQSQWDQVWRGRFFDFGVCGVCGTRDQLERPGSHGFHIIFLAVAAITLSWAFTRMWSGR